MVKCKEDMKTQARKTDGWSSFQSWTQKWNRFFATLFCVLAFSLLFAIVVVNVINAERQVLDKEDSEDEPTTIQLYEHVPLNKEIAYENHLTDPIPGCLVESNCSILCQRTTCSIVREQLADILKDPKKCPLFDLKLDSIEFYHQELRADEVCVHNGVRSLEIRNSDLSYLLDGAFNDSTYRTLENLHLNTLSLRHISKDAFIKLDHLQELAIVKCPHLSVVENEVMVPISRSLKQFTMEANVKDGQCSYHPFVFTGNASMKSLEQIIMKGNNFENILDSTTFGDLRVLKSLEMIYNRITELPSTIFDKLGTTNSIRRLDLSNNLLTFLPAGIFKNFKSSNIRIHLDHNPWHCDAELKEIQELVRDDVLGIMFSETDPRCKTPEHLHGQSIRDVDLNAPPTPIDTGESTTEIAPETEEPTTSDTTTSGPVTHTSSTTTPDPNTDCPIINNEPICVDDSYPLGCMSAKMRYTDDLNSSFLIKVASFRVQLQEVQNTIVEIRVRNPSKHPYFIMWFKDDTGQTGLISNEQVMVKCQCAEDDEEDHYTQQLSEDSLYIFCVLAQGVSEGSPFDCLPFKTRGPPFPGKDIWLTKDDQLIAYSLTLVCLVLCCLIGAVTMYMIVRRIPTLLKGADGVVIMKRSDMIKRQTKKKDSTMSIISYNSSSIESIQARPLPIPEASVYLTPTPHKSAIYNSLLRDSIGRRASDSSLDSYHSYISSKGPESCHFSAPNTACNNNFLDVPNTPPPLPPKENDSIEYGADYTRIVKTPEVEQDEYEIYAVCQYVETSQVTRVHEN